MGRKRSQSYSGFIRAKFLRYSVSLIVAMYLAFVLFMLCNVAVVTVRGTQAACEALTVRMEEGFGVLEQEILRLCEEDTIRAALNADTGALQKAKELLYTASNNQNFGNTFALTDSEGRILASNLYQGNQTAFQQNPQMQALRNRLESHPESVEVSIGEIGYGFGQNGNCTFAGRIQDGAGKAAGYLFFTLKDESLYEIILSNGMDETMVTDQFDNIILSTYRQVPDPMEKYPSGRLNLQFDYPNVANWSGKPYYVTTDSFYQGKFRVFMMASIVFQIQMFLYGSILLLLVSLLFTAAILSVLRNSTQRRMGEIDDLVDAARRIGQGELGYRIRAQKFGEFQVLADALNMFSENLSQMMKTNRELAENKRLMELKQLESQFNPHFVFNTLEILRYQILMDTRSASDMVRKLANLMRYCVNFGNTLVPLKTDIQFLGDYLALQKMRFGQRLEYRLTIEEELLDREFPKLLLQPLVENSLNHGMKKSPRLFVEIIGQRAGENVEFLVRDNGDGIQEDVLTRVRRRLEREQISGKHFDLYGVQRTIRLTYGPNYGLTIESREEEGTLITMIMPLAKTEGSHA